MADLTIVIDARQLTNGEFQTMSSYWVPPSGKVVFKNAANNHGDLVITPKPPAAELPFCKSNGTTPKILPPIPPGGSGDVKICDNFNGSEFLYTAQIGTTNPEDPIVIIERRLNFSSDPLAMLFLGLGIGAAVAYFIVKARARKMRPQQG